MKPGRNDPCPCGSGKKYKKCCQPAESVSSQPPQHPPNKAMELNRLAALFNGGRFGELEHHAQVLSRQYPSEGMIWKLLGLGQMMQGKDATGALQKATALLPGDVELHNYLGISLTSQKQFRKAEDSFQHALKLKSAYPEACYNLNLAYMAQGRSTDAEQALRRALDIQPDYAMAHYGLGLALKAQGRLPEAEAHLLRALEIKPAFAAAHYCLGFQHMEQGRSTDAENRFRKTLELESGHTEARLKLGICLAERGCFIEAAECFRQILALNPTDIETRFNLVQISKADQGDENLAMLLDIEKRNGEALPDHESALLNYAIGKALDDRGQHDEAFVHFMQGAKCKRATLDYCPTRTRERFVEIARVFDRASIERLRGSGHPTSSPVFILGMPRSGTTLIEQIISSHPAVHGAGELPDLLEIAAGMIGGGDAKSPQGLHELTPEHLAGMGTEYLSRLQAHSPTALRITDKTPLNFIAIGLIHLILPNARIIHIRRNPLDTCVSCFTQLFQGKMDFSYDLKELGDYYLDYLRLMQHWREVLPSGAFIEVDYEDVVSDQEAQTRRLIEYCGLEWDDACLDLQNNKRAVRTASVTQVRQPVYQSSVERWRRYERHLKPLLDILDSNSLRPG